MHFSFLHQTQKLVFGSILNSRTFNYSLKKCIIYFLFREQKQWKRCWEECGWWRWKNWVCWDLWCDQRHWMLLLPAVSQSSSVKATHENENESAARLAVRFLFWTKLDKRRKTDWGQLALKGFIIEKKSICWHNFSTYRKTGGALFCIQNRLLETRRWHDTMISAGFYFEQVLLN